MSVLKVQDANSKEFTIDTDELMQITGDFGEDRKAGNGITDSLLKNRLDKLHEVEFVDSAGSPVDVNTILNDMQSGKTHVTGLDIEMEASHSGSNHNYCVYYEDSMEKDCESFVNPFHKPVLKNHNSYSGEPIGRVSEAWHGPSALTDSRTAIHLKARITDVAAIPKFLDGRYGTVSIAGSMGTVTCNICGKTILKDGKFKFCGHYRGETYNNKLCYWGARDIEYHEVSVVNTPADDYAQIMKVTVLTDSDDNKNHKEGQDMQTNTENSDAVASVKTAISDIIDQMLGNSAAVNPVVPNGNGGNDKIEDNTQPVENKVETEQEAPTNENVTDNADVNDNIDSLKSKVNELEQQIADAKSENEKLAAELKDANEKLEANNAELESVQKECDSYKDKCIALATSNKELVVDSIISKENVASDEVEKRRNELMEKSMKELDTFMEDAVKVPERREPAHVDTPTLGVEQKDARDKVGDSETTPDTDVKDNADTKAKKTVEDYANEIVGKLYS